MKQLRENQKTKKNNRLSCRDSKITHMFEHIFMQKPGCGSLGMMICINPQPIDFDENIHAMELADVIKEIDQATQNVPESAADEKQKTPTKLSQGKFLLKYKVQIFPYISHVL